MHFSKNAPESPFGDGDLATGRRALFTIILMLFGIDFGTTNSYLGFFSGERSQIIQGQDGPAVPSLAEEGEVSFPSIKRYLGRRPEELEELGLDYILLEDGLLIPFAGKTFSAEELAARVFEKIQSETGTAIPEAVLAVPAHYDDAQRQATVAAAKRAGISVRRLIHEPTAAALAYGKDRGRVLVFDFGGGTLDISLLDIEEDFFQVLQTKGDRNLGGDDFDLLLASYIAKESGLAFTREILQSAKEAKHELSGVWETEVVLFNESPVRVPLTRDDFETIVAPLTERVRELLGDFKDADPDWILLVGGMSRMPLVRRILSDFFQKEPESIQDPETVVARGAALYAASLAGADNALLVDVTPLSLGIEVEGEDYRVLIPAGSTVPVKQERVFTTARDDQASVEINILQGESTDPQKNRLLGRMRLLGIPPAPAGVPEIWVSFQVDVDGLLQVFVAHPESGQEEEIVIKGRAFQDIGPGSL